jgi:hypothetical protein
VTTETTPKNNNRRTLILIFLTPILVLIPFGIIYWMADSGMMEYETFNRGELINPPVQIAELGLHDLDGDALNYGKPDHLWSLVVVGDRFCAGGCEKILYLTRQSNTALGKKMNKLRRFYISLDGEIDSALGELLKKEHPKLTALNGKQQDVLARFPQALSPNSFYLVDRGGWIMMSYQSADLQPETLNALGKDVLKDMNRLIK